MSDAPPVISYATEVRRKALHLGALVLPASLLLWGRDALWVLGPVTVLAVAGDVLRVRSDLARRWIHGLFGGLMRPEETPPLGGPVRWNGATTMFVAVVLCGLLFPPAVAAAAIAMQQVGDAAAALVGRRWGRHRWPGSPKSVEGSLAFAACAAVIGALVTLWPGVVLPVGALAAGVVVATVVEALPVPIDDNLRVPLAAGIALMSGLL